MMFIIIFAVNLGILPASGYVPFFQDPIANITVMILPILATGLIRSPAKAFPNHHAAWGHQW